MYSKMEMPKYSNLVKLVAQIGALIGVIFGVISCLVAISAFQYGFLAGISGMITGIMTVVGSLASLGLVYCFLASVEAQIDTRNAIISNFNVNLPSNIPYKIKKSTNQQRGVHIADEVRLYY